ncbi:MAG: hypothetical protein KDC62_09650 [Aequorivita sp.]|nr:hypothetical protein [Aequorivita sp.]
MKYITSKGSIYLITTLIVTALSVLFTHKLQLDRSFYRYTVTLPGILALLFLFFPKLAMAQQNEWPWITINLNQIETRKDSFLIKQNGKEAGYWIWETYRTGDSLNIKDVSVLTDVVQEKFTLHFNLKKMLAEQVDMTMQHQSNSLNVDISRQSPRNLKAHYVRKGNNPLNHTIDTTYTKNVVLRPVVFGLLPAIISPKNTNRTIETFFLSSGSSAMMQLEYVEESEIEVPAGKFNTYKYRFSGEKQLSNMIYISQTKPYRIIKVEVIGQPLTIELVK